MFILTIALDSLIENDSIEEVVYQERVKDYMVGWHGMLGYESGFIIDGYLFLPRWAIDWLLLASFISYSTFHGST